MVSHMESTNFLTVLTLRKFKTKAVQRTVTMTFYSSFCFHHQVNETFPETNIVTSKKLSSEELTVLVHAKFFILI